MKFSIGVEYALHCLIYMVDTPPGKAVGIKDLAAFQGISETYLSKVYSKLGKAGIVKSIPGVNGGYVLARDSDEITFLNVVDAIEGNSPLFQCAEIRQNTILLDKDNLPDTHTKCPCLIKVVMLEAEDQMRQYLNSKTLNWLHEQWEHKLPKEHINDTLQWFTDGDSRHK